MIIKNVKIVLTDQVIENGWVEIENKIIKSINSGTCNAAGIDGEGKILMPGFIDCHTHGGYGVDFENSSIENYMKFSKMLTQEGITSYIHSSVTNSLTNNMKYLKTFTEFKQKENDFAKCLGVHLEGPFISKEKKGAHELGLLEDPNVSLMKELNQAGEGNICMVTYAPELDNGDFVKYLLENNIVPAAGHSNLDYPIFKKDLELGVKHITHLFNGMSGIAHQKPGLALAAMDAKNVLCEVITDGIHIDREVLKLIYRLIGFERITIITDSMIAKGMPDGDYKLGNLDVKKTGMKATLSDGSTLAGSAATYNFNVKVMYQTIENLKLNQLIYMTSINAAKQFNIFDKTGSIEVDKLADLVLVDNEMNVYKTFVNGKCVYENNINPKTYVMLKFLLTLSLLGFYILGFISLVVAIKQNENQTNWLIENYKLLASLVLVSSIILALLYIILRTWIHKISSYKFTKKERIEYIVWISLLQFMSIIGLTIILSHFSNKQVFLIISITCIVILFILGIAISMLEIYSRLNEQALVNQKWHLDTNNLQKSENDIGDHSQIKTPQFKEKKDNPFLED